MLGRIVISGGWVGVDFILAFGAFVATAYLHVRDGRRPGWGASTLLAVTRLAVLVGGQAIATGHGLTYGRRKPSVEPALASAVCRDLADGSTPAEVVTQLHAATGRSVSKSQHLATAARKQACPHMLDGSPSAPPTTRATPRIAPGAPPVTDQAVPGATTTTAGSSPEASLEASGVDWLQHDPHVAPGTALQVHCSVGAGLAAGQTFVCPVTADPSSDRAWEVLRVDATDPLRTEYAFLAGGIDCHHRPWVLKALSDAGYNCDPAL